MSVEERARWLSQQRWIDDGMVSYLKDLSRTFRPVCIYDIGACVGEYARICHDIWCDAEICCVEATQEFEFLFQELPYVNYYMGILGSKDEQTVKWYSNPHDPFGQSIYRENPAISGGAEVYYPESCAVNRLSMTLDTISELYEFTYPDLIKLDVQGSEIDILEGAHDTLKFCQHLIVELQCVEYNKGAKLTNDSIPYIESLGFTLKAKISDRMWDADYHFVRNM